MLLLISAVAALALARVVKAALTSLQALPKTNQDWIWY